MVSLRAVRYAESITVHVALLPDQSDGRIYPPYVSVKYGVATADDLTANKTVTVLYRCCFQFLLIYCFTTVLVS